MLSSCINFMSEDQGQYEAQMAAGAEAEAQAEEDAARAEEDRAEHEQRHAEHYLGDGLYAQWRDGMIVLRAPRFDGDDWVGLDSGTLNSFLDYLRNVVGVKL